MKRGLTVVALCALALCACGGTDSNRRIQYQVGGTATRAFLTYENATGGTEQQEVSLPWSEEFTGKAGDFLYVSAQIRDNDARRITCEIRSDGDVVEAAESEGRFAIATCSGTAD